MSLDTTNFIIQKTIKTPVNKKIQGKSCLGLNPSSKNIIKTETSHKTYIVKYVE